MLGFGFCPGKGREVDNSGDDGLGLGLFTFLSTLRDSFGDEYDLTNFGVGGRCGGGGGNAPAGMTIPSSLAWPRYAEQPAVSEQSMALSSSR